MTHVMVVTRATCLLADKTGKTVLKDAVQIAGRCEDGHHSCSLHCARHPLRGRWAPAGRTCLKRREPVLATNRSRKYSYSTLLCAARPAGARRQLLSVAPLALALTLTRTFSYSTSLCAARPAGAQH
jgi:hypothetical protein